MSLHAKSEFVRLLDKNLRDVAEDTYSSLPSVREKFYKIIDSDSAWEEFYGIGSLPDIPEFNGKLTYRSKKPQFHTKIENKTYALGVQVQPELMEDKKYNVLEGYPKALMGSAHRTQAKLEARPFQNAFSAAFDFMTSEEGVALCSSSHTTKSGTPTTTGFDNAGTSAMDKTSVAATRLAMRLFRDDISERIEVGNDLAIVCPDALVDTAEEIVGTKKGLDTGDGNMNPQYGRHEVIGWNYLDDTDSNNWFMVWKSRMKEDLVWLDRVKPTYNSINDFETFVFKHSVRYRCANGFKDWRWIYGHLVS